MLSIFMCGYNTEENNIKCDIQEEKEIFNSLKEYDVYTDVVDLKALPNFRRKLIMLLNQNISQEVKNNLNKMLNIVSTAQQNQKGIYWY